MVDIDLLWTRPRQGVYKEFAERGEQADNSRISDKKQNKMKVVVLNKKDNVVNMSEMVIGDIGVITNDTGVFSKGLHLMSIGGGFVMLECPEHFFDPYEDYFNVIILPKGTQIKLTI